MTRRAYPYAAVSGTQPGGGGHRGPVGAAPTLATRTHLGWHALEGLDTRGKNAATIPIQQPYPGQGAVFPAFPHVTGSSVAPNIRGMNLLVARNLMSPISHADARAQFSRILPPMAIPPTVFRRPPQTQSGRPTGKFTLEHPAPSQWWPTSQQWLAQRMRVGQQPPSGWRGFGGPKAGV